MHRCALAPFLVAPLTLAQTFVVDAGNGPGTHYTSIATAVGAVPDGSTLLVRPGLYSPFAIHGKGLTILGQGAHLSVFPTTGTFVQNTTASQTVVLRGLALDGSLAFPFASNCAGPLILEDLDLTNFPNGSGL